jgi:hypothetical protein
VHLHPGVEVQPHGRPTEPSAPAFNTVARTGCIRTWMFNSPMPRVVRSDAQASAASQRRRPGAVLHRRIAVPSIPGQAEKRPYERAYLCFAIRRAGLRPAVFGATMAARAQWPPSAAHDTRGIDLAVSRAYYQVTILRNGRTRSGFGLHAWLIATQGDPALRTER